MISRMLHAVVVSGISLAGLAGCATTDKNPSAQLEGANRNLSDQLARAKNDVDACHRDREGLNQRLAEALRAADQLRTQLASQPAPVAAEEPAPGWTAVPGGAMIAIEDDVLFASGKAVLRDQAKKTLDQVASTINGTYASKDILVFGHTDDRPIKKSGWDDNWQLSTERSLAVVRYLKERSVSTDRLVAAGCGEYRPRAKNDTDSNRQRNRRVEIFAIDPQSRTGRR